MKVGVKIWRVKNLDGLVREGKLDFIETMAIVGEDYSQLKDYGIPVTIHAEHLFFGVNPADPLLLERNIKSVNFAIKTADMFDAETIVIHPGCMQNHNCNLETSINFLKSVYDPRMIVENMPCYVSEKAKILNIGKGLEEIKQILSATKMGFCLDLGHAAVAASGSGLDYMELVKQFMNLKPNYFHMFDSILKSKAGDHMHLGEGELDILGFKKLLPKDAWVVLETPIDAEGRVRDIEFMRS